MSVRSFFSFFIILVITLQVGGPILSYAETADELKSNLDSLSAKIDALDKEIKDFNTKIDQTQGEAKTLKQALANLELQRTKLVKEINSRLNKSQPVWVATTPYNIRIFAPVKLSKNKMHIIYNKPPTTIEYLADENSFMCGLTGDKIAI